MTNHKPFFMVYIAGQARPKKVHKTIVSARADVAKYREEGGQRDVYILSQLEHFPAPQEISQISNT